MQPATILIIEDDPIVAQIYRRGLEKDGCAVAIAADGQAGLIQIQRRKPDAVLLDLMLPKLNGLELLRKVRAQPGLQDLPVIVLTNAFLPAMVQEAYAAGASTVFNKSNTAPQQVLDAMTMHWERAGASKAPSASVGEEQGDPSSPPLRGAVGDSLPAQAGGAGVVRRNRVSGGGIPPTSDVETRLLQTFFQQVPHQLASLKSRFREFEQAGYTELGGKVLQEIDREIRSLSGKAAALGLHPLAQMSAAIEALVKELTDRPASATPSVLRTATDALTFLPELSVPGLPHGLYDSPPLSVLAVDDDPVSLSVLASALEKSLLQTERIEQPAKALALASKRVFDAIFLDIHMPDLDGFEFCTALRAGGPNQATPVIFVTQRADFMARAQSALSGGNDLVAKPFLPIEITVKALTCCLRSRLRMSKRQQSG